MGFKDVLVWIISGGGAGVIGYWVVENVKWFTGLDPAPKRYVSYMLMAALGVLAYGGCVALGYDPSPTTWAEWITEIGNVILLACGVSQIAHAKMRLTKKRA